MAARRTRVVVAVVSVALALLSGPTAPAGAQVAAERSFFVVTGLFCLGPGPVRGVLSGVIQFEHAHGDIFRSCEAGDPPHLQVSEVHGARSASGGGGTSSPGATCRTTSYITVCSLPDGVSRVVAIFAVFEQPLPRAELYRLSQVAAGLR